MNGSAIVQIDLSTIARVYARGVADREPCSKRVDGLPQNGVPPLFAQMSTWWPIALHRGISNSEIGRVAASSLPMDEGSVR